MITGTLTWVRIQRYTDDIMDAINIGVCMAKSAVRKRTVVGGIIGKGVTWIGHTR